MPSQPKYRTKKTAPPAGSRKKAIHTMGNANLAVEPPRSQAIWLLAWRLAFGLCVLVVLVLALLPKDMAMPSTGWDKSNHLLAFSVMALLGLRAYPGLTIGVLAGLLAYGALIEVLQSFTPNRSADWQDIAADSVGLVLGWGTELLGRQFMRSLRASP
jgi:VanZ family protein